MKRSPSSSGSLDWPTWATVLLSALGGAAVAAVGTALVLRRWPQPAPVTPAAPPAPPPVTIAVAPDPSPPPAARRPRRPRRRKAAADPDQ
jgi:hypothetical protein